MKRACITGGHGDLAQAIARQWNAPEWVVETPGRTDLDVCDEGAIQSYFQNRSPDLLICAAGLTKDALLVKLTEWDWDEVQQVNFLGARHCANQVLPKMAAKGEGHVIFISSHSAIHPPCGQVAYASAKAALIGLTKDLATRFGPANVRVNVIMPGFLPTRMTAAVSQERTEKVRQAHALQRFNTAAEVARFVHFLHHHLPHTSGQCFQLDSRDPAMF
jgi:3-oxoacyl-[acyl-carrier protein] reductase